MNKSILEDVNLLSLVIAGFIAGYIMFIVDLALEGWFGLFGTYGIYKSWFIKADLFKGFEDIAIFLGHQLNAILFGIFLVNPYIWEKLPQNRILKGVIFGFFWHILVLVVAFFLSIGGSIWMKDLINMNLKAHISLFLLHQVWSISLSLFYKD